MILMKFQRENSIDGWCLMGSGFRILRKLRDELRTNERVKRNVSRRNLCPAPAQFTTCRAHDDSLLITKVQFGLLWQLGIRIFQISPNYKLSIGIQHWKGLKLRSQFGMVVMMSGMFGGGSQARVRKDPGRRRRARARRGRGKRGRIVLVGMRIVVGLHII